jgi:hypothetical protein
MIIKSILRVFVICLIGHFKIQAATQTSTASGGNWLLATTWVGGNVPSAGDDVVINGPVSVNANVTCKTLTINSTKTLSFLAGGYSVTLTGTWTTVLNNQGNINSNDGRFVFQPSSSAGQTVSGTIAFNNVIVSGVSQMTFNTGSTVNGTLRLINGSQFTNTGHPQYGTNSTMEISGNYSISTNNYLWGNSATTTAANLVILSGTISAQQNVNINKTLTVNTGASLNLAACCVTLKSPNFQGITNNGSLNLGGITVESGVTWNITGIITASNLTIQNNGTVNAGNSTLNLTYNTTGNCGATGKIIKLIGSGTFNAGTGTLVVNTSANGNATFEGNVNLNNLILTGGVITTNNAGTSVKIDGNLTVSSGSGFQYGNTINSGSLTFGNSSTITSNGGNTSNITNLPSAPAVTTVDNSLTALPNSNAGGGSFNTGLTLSSANYYELSNNLVVTGSRKVLIIYAPAELKTNGKTITADSIYVFGKLTINNPGGIDAFLGLTKAYIDTSAIVEYNSASTQTIKATTYGTLVLSGLGTKTLPAGTITVKRNFTVSGGTLNFADNPTFVFNGSSSQLVAGAAFKNVTFGGGGSKTLVDTAKITGRITITGSAQLVSNGLLTLVSDASGTASIGTVASTASIVGNVNYQRYIPAGRTWRFIGWPINGSTIANSWQKSIYITGPGTGGGSLGTQNSNGFDWTASAEQGVYTYNEPINAPLNNKWQGISGTSTTINSTLGYRIFIRGDRSQGTSTLNGSNYTPMAVTLTGIGTINTGDITLNLTSSNGGGSNNGWQLLANPYPSAVDWNNSAWVSARDANIQSTIYVYNPSQNKYGAWSPVGGSVNGGSNNIASGQAFFIKTMANTTLVFKETYKVDNPTAGLFGKTSTQTLTNNLKISLGETNKVYDETVVFMYPNATTGFDADLDALKPDGGNASISSFTIQDSAKLVFNAIPNLLPNQADTITLNIPLANYTYNYQLGFSGLSTFDTLEYSIYLYDSYSQQVYGITHDKVFPFSTTQNVPTSYLATRFKLIFANTNQPLPVKLIMLTAKRQAAQVVLNWKTTSEKNNKQFDIERSLDGVVFEKIGMVAGQGNSNKMVNYSFTDTNPAGKLLYYRLVQIDYNYTATTSVVVWVDGLTQEQPNNLAKLMAYPIPTNEVLHVTLKTAKQGSSVNIDLVDELGKTIGTEQVLINEPDYIHTLNTSNLKPGVYVVVVRFENGIQQHAKFYKN